MINVLLTEADLLAVSKLTMRGARRLFLILGIVDLLGIAVAVWLEIADPFHLDGSIGFMLGGAALLSGASLLYAVLVLLPKGIKRSFSQNKALQRPHSLSWDADKLTFTSEQANVALPWTDFRRWRANEGYFVLYITDRQIRVLPKRAFPEPRVVAEFSQLLADKVGPEGVARS
jgi:hypothetical protein